MTDADQEAYLYQEELKRDLLQASEEQRRGKKIDLRYDVTGTLPAQHISPHDHEQYATDGDLAAAVAALEAADTAIITSLADYQPLDEKGQADGYAGLGADNLVPTAQLGTGSASISTFLRGDQTYATPALADHNHTAGGDGGDLTGAVVSDYMVWTESSDPSAPAAGLRRIYAKSDGIYHRSSAAIVPLANIGANAAAGRVPFFSSANTIAGDSAFVWDDTNKRLGIGIASPTAQFHVFKSTTSGTPLTGAIVRADFAPASAPGAVTPIAFQMLSYYDSTHTPSSGLMLAQFLDCRVRQAGVIPIRALDITIANEGSGTIPTTHNLNLRSPIINGGGAITTAYGIQINPQKVSGVTTGYAIAATGAADVSYFAGQIYIGRTTGLTGAGDLDVNAIGRFGTGVIAGRSTTSLPASTSLDAGTGIAVDGTKVIGTRKTGWATASGTATRTTFATSTVTLPQLAERVKALIDDLYSTAGHGLIGA